MAGSLNRVLLIGRLGKDPEVKYTQAGQAVANFSIATDEGYVRDGEKVEKTEWHRVVAWGKQAEFCANYLRKGALIFVEGNLQTRQWQDQQGQTRYTTEVRCQRLQGLESKNASQPRPIENDTRSEQQEMLQDEDMGSPFPSEASSMDDLPF